MIVFPDIVVFINFIDEDFGILVVVAIFVMEAVVVKGEVVKLIVPWQILKNEIYCNNTKIIRIGSLILKVNLTDSAFLTKGKMIRINKLQRNPIHLTSIHISSMFIHVIYTSIYSMTIVPISLSLCLCQHTKVIDT